MKVSEAKEKICPFIKPNFEPLRYGESNNAYFIKCKTNECMAWQYTTTAKVHYCDNKPNDKCEEFIDDFLNNCWIEKLDEDEKEGYCVRLQK